MIFNKEDSRAVKSISIFLTISLVAFFIYYLTTDKIAIRILSLYKNRILERILYYSRGNGANKITSGRTRLQMAYIQYFFSRNPLRILFGGYQINTQGLDGEPINLILDAPHNTYIDIMMTCGLFGLVLFIYAIMRNLRRYWVLWRNGDDASLTSLIHTCATALFMFGLSVFPGTNYMYFLMI